MCFRKKFFSRFFPIFWSRYSCFSKKRVFALFTDDFFPSFFGRDIRVSGKKFSRFFPPFFGHDIRVFIKNVFSHFFQTIFSNVFCSKYTCVSGKKNFSRFFPHFWSQFSCVYKKSVFALFPNDFFPSFLARDIRVFLEKKFLTFFSPHFLVTIFVCL